MQRILDTLFWITLCAFLVLGTLIVLGQLVGVIGVSPTLVEKSAAWLNWPAFTAATLCALVAFVRQYLPDVPALDEKTSSSR